MSFYIFIISYSAVGLFLYLPFTESELYACIIGIGIFFLLKWLELRLVNHPFRKKQELLFQETTESALPSKTLIQFEKEKVSLELVVGTLREKGIKSDCRLDDIDLRVFHF